MKIRHVHDWNIPRENAAALQEQLKGELILGDGKAAASIASIAGADISYGRHSDLFFAAVILLSYPDLKILEDAYAVERSSFPYIPGLLSFREGPALLSAFRKLAATPDVVMFDGHGLAHPRGFGLASHLGMFLEIPTIGCAKSRLVGAYDEPGPERGASSPLVYKDQAIGAVLRTKPGVRPVFVSQGGLISLERAVTITNRCCRGYRLPEPVRQAHLAVNRLRLKHADN